MPPHDDPEKAERFPALAPDTLEHTEDDASAEVGDVALVDVDVETVPSEATTAEEYEKLLDEEQIEHVRKFLAGCREKFNVAMLYGLMTGRSPGGQHHQLPATTRKAIQELVIELTQGTFEHTERGWYVRIAGEPSIEAKDMPSPIVKLTHPPVNRPAWLDKPLASSHTRPPAPTTTARETDDTEFFREQQPEPVYKHHNKGKS